MIKRILSILPLAWALGFVIFAVLLPRPAEGAPTDAIVVLTGGPGRIERGLKLMEARKADRMLVSGVNRDVRPHELALAQNAPKELFDCCVDLGFESVDTRSNAAETAAWIKARDYKTVRLVTTDWHMRRARHELARALGPEVRVTSDAVRSKAGLGVLLKEYHKYLLSVVAPVFGF